MVPKAPSNDKEGPHSSQPDPAESPPLRQRKDSLLRQQSTPTFAAQKDIPRLPIPTLEETLDKLPKVLEALQTQSEQEETLKLVEEFHNGVGPMLQKMLQEYECEGIACGRLGSYIEEFWNDAYLTPDDSVVLNLNPFFVLEKHPDPKTYKSREDRAASLVFASLKMASLLKKETLPPDHFKGKPLCMDQFKSLFASARIPGGSGFKDHVHSYPNSTHVLVLIRNQFFYFQGLWPHNGNIAVDEQDIRDILLAIKKRAENPAMSLSFQVSQAVGVLTSLPRNEWSEARQMIMDGDSEHNKEALRLIESALFVLVLDDHSPKGPSEMAANMLHGSHELIVQDDGKLVQAGSCCNRWYDKLQLIVCADGTAGVNFEHSVIDGHTALRYASDIYAETVVQFAQSITKMIHGDNWIPDNMEAQVDRAALSMVGAAEKELDVFPKQLIFKLSDEVKDRMRYAEAGLADQINASDTAVLEFHGYGKNLIVRNRLSPDSFVQMSMMLAYYQLYGKFVCTYESVLTKAFYHGRTEAMRGATPQAKKFCEIWCDRKATKEQKLLALQEATREHSRLVRECEKGKGVDRHLYALKSIARRNDVPMPALFKSKAWHTLNNSILSTSNCGNPSLRLFGFGPVVPDGIGIGYIIKDHGMQFSVSSKHRQTLRYVNSLEDTLNELSCPLKAMSEFVCAAHGQRNSIKSLPPQHRITLRNLHNNPERKESIAHQQSQPRMPRLPSQLNVTANALRFSNVVQKKTLRYIDLKDLGDDLSFAHASDSDLESLTNHHEEEESERHEEGESGIW